MRLRAFFVAVGLTGTALLVPSVATASPAPAASAAVAVPESLTAAATKSCVASVSNAKPAQNSKVTVSVKGVGAKSAITTVAHYKTTNTRKTATASSTGTASTVYSIGRATHGFKVRIDVTAVLGSAHWACQTAFTTR